MSFSSTAISILEEHKMSTCRLRKDGTVINKFERLAIFKAKDDDLVLTGKRLVLVHVCGGDLLLKYSAFDAIYEVIPDDRPVGVLDNSTCYDNIPCHFNMTHEELRAHIDKLNAHIDKLVAQLDTADVRRKVDEYTIKRTADKLRESEQLRRQLRETGCVYE